MKILNKKVPAWLVVALLMLTFTGMAFADRFVNLIGDDLLVTMRTHLIGPVTIDNAVTFGSGGTVTFSGTVNGAGVANNTNSNLLGTTTLQNATASGTTTLNGAVVRNGAMTGVGTAAFSNTVTFAHGVQLVNAAAAVDACTGAIYGRMYANSTNGACICNGTGYEILRTRATCE
jgi:hypothetical protein